MSVYTNKAYVAFDADNDIRYYRLMTAWKKVDGSSFGFYDAHDINNLMSYSSEETIKSKLRERMMNTRVFMILVGDNTKYLYKFVRWEIEQAIKRDIPIVVVNLNGKKGKDSNLCPAILNDVLSVHISFNKKAIIHAIEKWPSSHNIYFNKGENSAYSYNESIYN
jgi:hypothetical protein